MQQMQAFGVQSPVSGGTAPNANSGYMFYNPYGYNSYGYSGQGGYGYPASGGDDTVAAAAAAVANAAPNMVPAPGVPSPIMPDLSVVGPKPAIPTGQLEGSLDP